MRDPMPAMAMSPASRTVTFAASGTAAKRETAAAAAMAAIACLLLSLLYCDRPALLLTSDSLTPADFVWDLLHRDSAWSSFEFPHSPGFFPDETVLAMVQGPAGDWRIAMAAWTAVVFAGLLAVCALVASGLAQCGRGAAAFVSVCTIVPLMTAAALASRSMEIDTGGQGPLFPWILTLLPGGHGGNFLLIMTGAAIAGRAARRGAGMRDAALLAALSFAGVVSDQLTLIGLTIPAAAALLSGLAVGSVRRDTLVRLLTGLGFGAMMGLYASARLDKQYMPGPTFASSLEHIVRFLAGLDSHPDVIAATLLLTGALGFHLWRSGLRAWIGAFWPVFIGTGAYGSLAFTAILYEDVWSFRYAFPALWGAVFLTAACLARWPLAQSGVGRGAVATVLAAAALAGPLRDGRAPALLLWHDPLAACLRDQGFRAGLADFWIARKATVGSDWRLQVQPIDAYGQARIWVSVRSAPPCSSPLGDRQ